MLNLIQLITAILLIVCILLQQRGSGLGSAFGGENSVYRTKRGAEKTIFISTIIFAALFLGLSFINVYRQTAPKSAEPPSSDQSTAQETSAETSTPADQSAETPAASTDSQKSNNIFDLGADQENK